MGKKIGASVTCPQCEHKFSTQLYRTIWVEDASNREMVLNDQVNAVTCPKCDFHQRLEFPFLCTNVRQGFALWYEPYPDSEIDKDIYNYRKLFGNNHFYSKAPRIKNWDDFKKKLLEMESSAQETIPKIEKAIPSMNFDKKHHRVEEFLSTNQELKDINDNLQKLFEGSLKEKEIFSSIRQTHDFPLEDFKSTVSAIQSGKAGLSFGLPNPNAFEAVATNTEKNLHKVGMAAYWLAAPIALITGVAISENYWILLWVLLLFPLAFFGTHPNYKKAPKFLIGSLIGILLGLSDESAPLTFVSAFFFLAIAGYSYTRYLYNKVLIARALEMESALMFLLGCNFLCLCDARWTPVWTPSWIKKRMEK